MKKSIIQLLRCALLISAVAYLAVCGYLYTVQRQLLFRTDATVYADPDREKLPEIQVVEVVTQDGIALTSWFQPPSGKKQTILYLHGNASGLPKLTEFYQQIVKQGYGLLALSYRGYTGNAGSPTEDGLYMDAHAAVRYLYDKHDIPATDVIVMGRSLGSGVAMEIARHYAFYGLVLISPYTNIQDVAQDEYPLIPVRWLMKDRFASIEKAGNITMPTLVFHGAKDTLIAETQAKQLFEAIAAPKQYFLFETADHYSVPFAEIMRLLNILPVMRQN
jgi:uncharacterized protein